MNQNCCLSIFMFIFKDLIYPWEYSLQWDLYHWQSKLLDTYFDQFSIFYLLWLAHNDFYLYWSWITIKSYTLSYNKIYHVDNNYDILMFLSMSDILIFEIDLILDNFSLIPLSQISIQLGLLYILFALKVSGQHQPVRLHIGFFVSFELVHIHEQQSYLIIFSRTLTFWQTSSHIIYTHFFSSYYPFRWTLLLTMQLSYFDTTLWLMWWVIFLLIFSLQCFGSTKSLLQGYC